MKVKYVMDEPEMCMVCPLCGLHMGKGKDKYFYCKGLREKGKESIIPHYLAHSEKNKHKMCPLRKDEKDEYE